jgi:hypothetical protein
MGGELAQAAGGCDRMRGLRDTEGGRDGMGMRRDHELSEQEEDPTQ